jgi:type IV pilus assembly protein PilQ
MKKSTYLKKVCLWCLVLGLCGSAAYTGSESQQPTEPPSQEVGREDPFSRLAPQSQKVGQPQQLLGPASAFGPELFVESIMLKFLDANNLKKALDQMTSEHGIVAVDTRTNSLIVSDTRENLDKIMTEIKKTDKTPRQIMIEVVIIDVQLDDDTEIGVNWDILSDKYYDISYRQNFTSRLGSTIEDATTIGNATAFNTTGSGGDFVLISGTVRNVVHALQQKKNVEILASPRAMLVSGGTASIETVEEIPYTQETQTGQGPAMVSTAFKEVGIKLTVSALLTEDDYILLTVKPEQSVNTGVFGISGIPVIDTRKAETKLILKNGDVAVIGGLRRKERTELRNQVPLLGDLPLVGLLFRKQRTAINNRELIVLLSPHIYEGQPPSEPEMTKFNEIRNRPMLQLPAKDGNNSPVPDIPAQPERQSP